MALLGGLNLVLAEEANSPAETAYLFTYYTRNGEDGLHLACSSDGYKWETLNGGRSYLAPTVGKEKVMRDPSLARGLDGVYHLVWTLGLNEISIGHASTRDFIHWSPEEAIPVMTSEPAAKNALAPGVVFNAKWQQYFIFWASAVKGMFANTDAAAGNDVNGRIFCTTTKDFKYFMPTRLLFDQDFPVVDATILQADKRFYLIVKDETSKPPKKNLRITSGTYVDGPYGQVSAPFSPERLLAGAPSAIKIGDEFIVYFDAYGENHYVAMSSRDLKTWQDVTARMTFPGEGTPGRVERMRHGTVIGVPAALVEQLRSASQPSAPAPTPPPAAGPVSPTAH